MSAIKITAVVSGVSSTGVYTIVPVIDKETFWVQKSTGKILSPEETEKVTSSDLELKTRLKVNDDFWTKNPSMNLRLAPDNESGRSALHTGDVVDISITVR